MSGGRLKACPRVAGTKLSAASSSVAMESPRTPRKKIPRAGGNPTPVEGASPDMTTLASHGQDHIHEPLSDCPSSRQKRACRRGYRTLGTTNLPNHEGPLRGWRRLRNGWAKSWHADVGTMVPRASGRTATVAFVRDKLPTDDAAAPLLLPDVPVAGVGPEADNDLKLGAALWR